MLLEKLLSGKEHSSCILLEDSLELSAIPLLSEFVSQTIDQHQHLLLLSVEHPHETLLRGVVNRSRVKVFDAFTNPYGWTTSTNKLSAKTNDFNVTPITYLNDLRRVCDTLEKAIHEVGTSAKFTLVIDSLKPFLSTSVTFGVLRRITSLAKDASRIIGAYHGDLPQPTCTKQKQYSLRHPLHPSLAYLASTRIEVRHERRLDEVNSANASGARRTWWPSEDAFDYVDVESNGHEGGICAIEHQRRSGKVAREINGFSIFNDGSLSLKSEDELRNDLRQFETKRGGETVDESADPTANLSFNLTLTEEQKNAKSKVTLPYVHSQAQGPGAGTIYYAPDAADDFDEDDPDDDLNF